MNQSGTMKDTELSNAVETTFSNTKIEKKEEPLAKDSTESMTMQM